MLAVGAGQALILGTPEVTAFWALDDGGAFIQRIIGDGDREVMQAVEKALADAKQWKKNKRPSMLAKASSRCSTRRTPTRTPMRTSASQ